MAIITHKYLFQLREKHSKSNPVKETAPASEPMEH